MGELHIFKRYFALLEPIAYYQQTNGLLCIPQRPLGFCDVERREISCCASHFPTTYETSFHLSKIRLSYYISNKKIEQLGHG